MSKTGCLITFCIFLVVALVYDCIDTGRRQEEKKEYEELKKRLMEYVDVNDFSTAYKIMDEEGIDVDYVAIAEIEYMIKNRDFMFALNVSKDRLNDEGYYANSVLENLIHVYNNGGEDDVVKAMSLINYPLINNTTPRYWAGTGYSSYMGHWFTDEINEIHSKNNNSIKKLLIHLDYQGAELSPKFRKTLVALLLPSVSYSGGEIVYNYDEANEICKKFRLK